MGFNRSCALKQACITKKANTMLASWVSIVPRLWQKWPDGFLSFMCFEKSLHGLKKQGGVWGHSPPPPPPPPLQTQCSHDGFQSFICCDKSLRSLKKLGGLGGGAPPPPPPPPHLQALCSHDGFQYALKKACTAKKGGGVGGGGAQPLSFPNTMLASGVLIVHML